jgi:hypothetical protein
MEYQIGTRVLLKCTIEQSKSLNEFEYGYTYGQIVTENDCNYYVSGNCVYIKYPPKNCCDYKIVGAM